MPKIVEVPPDRPERLALNLFELDRIPEELRIAMLADKLDLSGTIRIDKKRPDETAVAFKCDLLTAASICDVIRSNDRKLGDFPTRVYLKRVASWSKLPADAVLTRVVDGNVVLDPKMFKPIVVAKAYVPPPPKVFRFGGAK